MKLICLQKWRLAIFCCFPAQGPVRGVRRKRQADLLVHVHSPVRQLFAVRPWPVLRLGQTVQDLQTLPARVSTIPTSLTRHDVWLCNTCRFLFILFCSLSSAPKGSCRTWPTRRVACARAQWSTRGWPSRSARACTSVVSWKCRKCWKCTRSPGIITARRKDATWSRSGTLH